MFERRTIRQLSANIVHVYYTKEDGADYQSELVDPNFKSGPFHNQICEETDESLAFYYEDTCVLRETKVCLRKKEVYEYQVSEQGTVKKKMTANGEVACVDEGERQLSGYSYKGYLEFQVGKDELLMGLGQYEDGIFNYRNHREYLYQSNMRIAIPFLITTGHYGIFVDTESDLIFDSSNQEVSFTIDTTKELSYYVIVGESVNEILQSYWLLTGKAPIPPRWLFGYMQSKERYKTGEELEQVANEFLERRIPIDCLVLDWYTWEEGLWGEKVLDKKRFPQFGETVKSLHDKDIHLMVSVWPNMSPEGSNYKEFAERKQLLSNATVYDAYNKDARACYFEQCQRELFAADIDALWCDSAEPFSDADWSGEEKRSELRRYEVVVDESQKHMNWEQLNSYGLYHAKGIYENWREQIPHKRVVNLTRSGYASGQRYGTILWSGDICAKWKTVRAQIVEGLKAGLSGVPYWTMDIGGFFVVKDKYENRGCNNTSYEPLWFWNGDYNDGVADYGYRELYTRWMQLGTFLPVFRSHGTDTPREPWQFGEAGTMFYDAIVKSIQLRYQLIPYIYSHAALSGETGIPMMRSLVSEFESDAACGEVWDEFLCGDAFLVAPVLEPMYYGVNSEPITDVAKTRSVYLPKGHDWYDFWTNQIYEGGQKITVDTPIDTIPVMVKAGAIIPCAKENAKTTKEGSEVSVIRIYEGADGSFIWHQDSGEGYEYENGEYCKIAIRYDDALQLITLERTEGDYPVQPVLQIQLVRRDGSVLYKDGMYKEKIQEIHLL